MDMELSGLEDYICSTFENNRQAELIKNSRKLCLFQYKDGLNDIIPFDSEFKNVIFLSIRQV
jgi:hypothetical protein